MVRNHFSLELKKRGYFRFEQITEFKFDSQFLDS